jgi:uncharacterized membrane protein
MAFCGTCGAQIADGATTCAVCAGKTAAAPAGTGAATGAITGAQTGGMTDNVAGMLAYFTIIPAILFLVMDPYNKNRFVRFHAWQSVFFNLAWWALWIGLRIVVHIPLLGWLTIFTWPLIILGGFILWLVLVLKANQGQLFKLPVIGDMAEKQANAM